MKKILLVLLICFSVGIFAKPSVAGTCNGGVEFQGAIDGYTYCRSSTTMTWWAAFAWCKKQGRELASMNQLCVDWAGATGNEVCPNMKVGMSNYAWSANPFGTDRAYNVDLGYGGVYYYYRNHSYYYYAVCR